MRLIGCRRKWLLTTGTALVGLLFLLNGNFQSCEEDMMRGIWENSIDMGNRRCLDIFYKTLNLSAQQSICSQIIGGDQTAIEKARLNSIDVTRRKTPLTENHYWNMTRDCAGFKRERKYLNFALSKEEQNFPIAYSIVIHQNIEMFERLLRTIYTPQNVYCIHVDRKAADSFQLAVRAIASCFSNVFVASKLENVIYASWSRVQADLNCMEELLQNPVRWRYFINLCGMDFPLKTNAEIVRSLIVLNGKNSMESEVPSAFKRERWLFHHEVKNQISRTEEKKTSPPISTPMFTGNAYFVASREFVNHLLESREIQKFLKWAEDTYSPDEHVWATLQRIPTVPGSNPYNSKYHMSDMAAIARMVKWSYMEGDITKGAPYPKCTGTHRRAVCIYGSGDLHWILQQHHLFANKFDPEVDNTAIECLEEHLRYKAIYRTGLM
ncbi:beta-1,3-galactosyl-O-glycosyl-glycoprotein beta-1,6-N-acetylglucosaminyltransferase 3-like [Chiloscyllium plagiosum]|uniref:beta-1,3-galactosyl-O-glycosyl-glycoprotein beta-1,6-N-acetylglucosaminyltransferase 3-like n=1 Tax=Chiloscyllium plagiosum TaxID=36176 RepID=UPI001CB80137|nr:beta-1,3-galactosyl-O-glycosyl-glycoprotein beta-1,6-N-acetylglucosaminyltransferase 3-like [Chiloscyllium plagiosum]